MDETTTEGSDGSHRLFATLMTVLMLGSVGLAAGAGTVAASHDNGAGANYTVELPNEKDHYPGEQGGKASIQHLATAGDAFQDAEGFEVLEFIVLSSQDVDFSSCTTENTRAFGVDRGNDDSGTHTDDPLLQHREDSEFTENKIIVDFFDEDSIAGESTYLNRTDQIVAVQDGCYTMPQEPGWYQLNSRVNGTTYQGNHLDISEIKSHYFYICECANEEEAREKLGPPPSESSDGSDGGDESTATPTATDSGGDSTPTATDSGGDSTPTATDSGGDSTPTPTDSQDTTGTDSTSPSATTTDDGGTATDGDDPAAGTPSPTDNSGPGFGLVAALIAIVSAAAVALRRQ